ncbi:YqaE/Pmp3 family membrane protein [Fontibacter flavus]|uniref:YqaE/Pmp3 family membrane protein n=1 Tax=Fontibacter flavus TaxID=654838 RepID=A0ABV6FWS0_9BACT|nr:YqaE/Pmp3 family membrane protein [Cyclobacteriaceae bacterium]
MRYVIAFFLPWLSLILQGKIFSGIICLILQITIIGWLPAAIWAIMSVHNMYEDRRVNKIVRAIKSSERN